MTPRLSFVIVLASSGLVACESKEPSCSDVSMHVGRMYGPAPGEDTRDIEGAFLGHCINDGWSVEVRRCLVNSSVEQPQNCKSKLTEAQAASLDKDLAVVEDRQASHTIPQACLDLEVQIAVAQSCEAIPKQVRDQIKTNLAASKKRWETVADKRLLAPECGAAIAALKQATSECAKPAPAPTPPSAPK